MERTPGAVTVEACSRALHPDERADLAEAAPGEERRILFGRIRTREEPCRKGLGTGLSRSPAADCLGADTGRHPPGWTVIDIPCGARHTAAAAVRGPHPPPSTSAGSPGHGC
ncbi:hypothetical protein ACFFKE_10935 [Streptomyces mutabilis]|uniref:hypothetical protein n=1 Tax=Streptomyces mutabilis TaxID=67332 RepID=UPI00177B8C3B|nr:hypothetical protein [Streptomyces mutabilis]GGQ46536.1 hypothetical protein GCM10010279_65160 [Streptomyces mutabilis]